MDIKSISGTICACLAVVSFNANSALVERLGGLAYYDTDADLTWLADANYSQTSGYDSDGLMAWSDAKSWAMGLEVDGISGWRLPDTLQPDPSCSSQSSAGVSGGFYCTGSDMGNLFYNVLGGVPHTKIFNTHNDNYYLFENIQSDIYWLAQELTSDPDFAYYFSTYSGSQGAYLYKSDDFYAWAVHDGDVGAVPIPSAVWLFGSGLIGLIGIARRKAWY